MKEEIKEILNWLNQIIKENKESDVSLNGCVVPFKTLYKLQDYITNLQEEINKLTSESTEWEERTYCWQDRAENLEIIIDKAIEKLESIRVFGLRSGKTLFSTLINESIDILQGEDTKESEVK